MQRESAATSAAIEAGLAPAEPTVLLTVEVEDYFHAGRFAHLIRPDHWPRFESRVIANTERAIELLASFDVRATFFVLGWIAERLPHLVKRLVDAGHEVASMGYAHRDIGQLDPTAFRQDLSRSREILEDAGGRRVLGHRIPNFIGPRDLWLLDTVAEEEFAYDSSLKPIFGRFRDEPWRRTAHVHRHGARSIWEFPLSTAQAFGLSVPIAGAGYFRHFPHSLVKPTVLRWLLRNQAPFVMYFRVWELDPEQPRIGPASQLKKLRHYRNLGKVGWVVRDYLRWTRHLPGSDRPCRFTTISDYLGLRPEVVPARPPAPAQAPLAFTVPAAARPAVTVVVPCYNEQASLPFLANTLAQLEKDLDSWQLSFVLVDDGSVDDTWRVLQALFGSRPNCQILRHERNRGIAAAVVTGLTAARTEIAACIDCDCTYDPQELGRLLPLLTDDVDCVTASPYHPEGGVQNVPPWRLLLSRSASRLYRLVLRHKLWTYTSCFRVYRRSAVAGLAIKESGFLGVTEILGALDLAGARIVECPTVLNVRLFGHSKMKALRAVAGHLRLMAGFAAARLVQRRSRAGTGGAAAAVAGERKAEPGDRNVV
jgi:polysaccharide deacetylase family protein (PEP-CTERM system associated)